MTLLIIFICSFVHMVISASDSLTLSKSPSVPIEMSNKNLGISLRHGSESDQENSSPELFSNSIGSYKGEWSLEAMRSSLELIRKKKTEKEKLKEETESDQDESQSDDESMFELEL
ncbi:MAG: hypothetical protein WD055_00620 [Candidatus Dependentiae bacterium]